ncbi:hypothetical protein NLG97_g3389 [Lecanicillium saksenae]|uniref:Uncharacterized protein n=1 Tax=Lecanicillium saksenae TaxID=468837 RepID=A0ACC1QYB0_9HYPO|nr:hypothetical protein NLG97_g3389 [Lecanicillium saksenae]
MHVMLLMDLSAGLPEFVATGPRNVIIGRECTYVASRRGGARRRTTTALSVAGSRDEDAILPTGILSQLRQIDHLVAPGAGLHRIETAWSDSRHAGNSKDQSATGQVAEEIPLRIYGSNHDLLNAYYTFIHTYFPILPPPTSEIEPDQPTEWISTETFTAIPFTPASPVGLAIASILALIPVQPSTGPDPASAAARRALSRQFAQASLLQVEEDSDYISRVAGCQSEDLEQEQPFRLPFHSQVPLELEAILALLVLSNHEHTQCGNLLKMATRAGQAVIMAKCLSLHRLGIDADVFAEARRRAWWMTIAEPLGRDDDFTTPYPQFESDKQVWSLYMTSLRITMSSIRLAAEHRTAVTAQADTSTIYERMEELDARIVECTRRAEEVELAPLYTDPASQETVAAYRMRGYTRVRLASARIRLHRYQAFSDMPLFNNVYYDLTTSDSPQFPGHLYQSTPKSADSVFAVESSTEICVESALMIARQLRGLNPRSLRDSSQVLPRVMPTCTCCAMQATYALLMRLFKLRAMHQVTATVSRKSERLEEELRNGLRSVISALAGFAESFEAIRGMRDEIESAINVAFQGIVL